MFFYYIFTDYFSGDYQSISRLFECTTSLLAFSIWMGLYSLKKRYFVVQAVIANVVVIVHYIVIIDMFYPEGLAIGPIYLVIALFLINVSFLGTFYTYFQFNTLNKKLKKTNDEKIKVMTQVIDGFLPICANCKAIRQDDGSWKSIEAYMTEKSDKVEFSHGLCEECITKLYPKLLD